MSSVRKTPDTPATPEHAEAPLGGLIPDHVDDALKTRSVCRLAQAYNHQEHFCRQFFSLGVLIDIFLQEQKLLSASQTVSSLGETIVSRLLRTSDRNRWRKLFLQVLETGGHEGDALYEFVRQDYYTSRLSEFPQREGEFLAALHRTLDRTYQFGGTIFDRLACVGAIPSAAHRQKFLVLFSNRELRRRYGELATPGAAVEFAFHALDSSAFYTHVRSRLSATFQQVVYASQDLAESAFPHQALRREGKRFRVNILQLLDGLPLLDGSSGFMSFFMSHCHDLNDVPISPYIGFTGALMDNRRLAPVDDLPAKIEASIAAGLRVLFVPSDNHRSLDKRHVPDSELLRLEPYSERTCLESTGRELLEQAKQMGRRLTPHRNTAKRPSPPSAGKAVATPSTTIPPNGQPPKNTSSKNSPVKKSTLRKNSHQKNPPKKNPPKKNPAQPATSTQSSHDSPPNSKKPEAGKLPTPSRTNQLTEPWRPSSPRPPTKIDVDKPPVSQGRPPSRATSKKSEGPVFSNDAQSRRAPASPQVVAAAPHEPRNLFEAEKIRGFVEGGGAALAVDSTDRFHLVCGADSSMMLAIQRGKMVHFFDQGGGLIASRKSPGVIDGVWLKGPAQWVLAFGDRFERLGQDLWRQQRDELPASVTPMFLATNATDSFYLVDDRARIRYFTQTCGPPSRTIQAPKPPLGITCSPIANLAAVSLPREIAVLSSVLKRVWSADIPADSAVCAFNDRDELWCALSTGRLFRFSAGGEKLLDRNIGCEVLAAAAVEDRLVTGLDGGSLAVFDELGQRQFQDELGPAVKREPGQRRRGKRAVSIFDLKNAGGGQVLLAVNCGTTLIKPRRGSGGSEDDRRRMRIHRETLMQWEKWAAASQRSRLRSEVRRFLETIDLKNWHNVLAFQTAYLERRASEGRPYGLIEQELELADCDKTRVLAQKTRPAFIDGSNVSRAHGSPKDKKAPARLEAILQVRRLLEHEENPALYPIVTVVDSTERHVTNDCQRLQTLIECDEILETVGRREADALIVNMIRVNQWYDCTIVTRDLGIADEHGEPLRDHLPARWKRDVKKWYESVRRPFSLKTKSNEIYFPARSKKPR